MSYVIEPAQPTAIPLAASHDSFPVRRVYCVGRNYAEHAKEMGGDPSREPPFFFCKPADAVVPVRAGTCAEVAYPPLTGDYHHEIELVVAIGRGGSDIPVEQALDHVFGYAVGLDMTRRDLQAKMKDTRRPWEIGKAADQSGPVGELYPASHVGHPAGGAIWVENNGQPRQRSDLAQQIWSVPEIVANLSQYFCLMPGDLIFTGTPEGVARVERGDVLRGGIDGLGELCVKFV